MNRSIVYRLVALLVVALLGVYYIMFDALGIHLWNQPYTVSVVLPSGGGIYTDASVTYRGVEVGKVSALHLEPNDVRVDLAINHGTRIPADVKASVKELTAAAEQYMDLVPTPPPGPQTADATYLKSGSVITNVSVPVSIGNLLNTVNSLVNSVHASDLNTVTSALANGLNQAGPDLRAIIDDSQTLIHALNSAVPSTVTLINSGNQVLNTFNNTGPDFNTLAAGLNRLSGTVANANGDVSALMHNGAVATAGLSQLLDADTTPMVGVINGFSDTAGLANARQGAMQAFFQILPVVSRDAALTVNPSTGLARFQVSLNANNTVCPYTSQMAEPTSLVATADLTRNCGTSAPDMLQRGAATAPTPSGGTP